MCMIRVCNVQLYNGNKLNNVQLAMYIIDIFGKSWILKNQLSNMKFFV